MRSEKERANRNLPKIDWNRYYLQVTIWRTNGHIHRALGVAAYFASLYLRSPTGCDAAI